MKSFDEIKKELLERIKLKQSELIECDINSETYSIILNELELLNLEHKEISNLKGNNFVRKLEEYKKLKSKYAFLENLTLEQIIKLITYIKETNKLVKESYDNGIEFSELTTDFKQEIQIKDIDYKKINNSETIEIIVDLLSKKYDIFKTDLEEFYSLLRNFSPYNYELLKSSVKNNKILPVKTLKELKGLGCDSLIEAIISNYEKIEKIKSELFMLPNKKEEMLDKINQKITDYLNSLYKSIGLFIKQNYLEYKNKLGLTIDEYLEEDIINLYSKILRQIADKNTEIKTILQKYKALLLTYKAYEKSNEKKINSIGIEINELKKMDINIYEFSKEDILEILSKIHTYNNLQIEKTKDENPTLLLKASEENN